MPNELDTFVLNFVLVSDILWNRNPLANSTNSLNLDLDTSDKAEPESPVCDELPASVLTPGSCERMITISSVVNHSLASIPLHRLADKPQSVLNRRSSGMVTVVVLESVVLLAEDPEKSLMSCRPHKSEYSKSVCTCFTNASFGLA